MMLKTIILGLVLLVFPCMSNAATPSTTGEQRIAILLVSFPSVPLLRGATADMYRSTYFGSGKSVDKFLREVSYGQTWATGNVFGPFVLDADYFNQPLAVRDAALRAAGAARVNSSSYNCLVLVVPQSSTGLVSGGMGSEGSETISLYYPPGAEITASTAWLGDVSAGSVSARLDTACHEMGHNLGLRHARAADFGDEPLAPVAQLPAPWDLVHDYGDSFSNMGCGSGHWAAPQKAALGWLESGSGYETVEADGSYTLQPYEQLATGLKALRVRRGTGNDAWLWLEFRRASVGVYDSGLPAGLDGALVHYEDAGWKDSGAHSNLLRFNVDTPRGLFFGNAVLAAGSSWSDPYSNLTLALGSDLAGGLHVGVAYAAAPDISVGPAAASVQAGGGQVEIDVTAPSGTPWTATSSASWISMTGANGDGDGRVVLTIAPTTIVSSRWARVTIGQAFAVITQAGLSGNISIQPAAVSVPASGAIGEIAVAANAADYTWGYQSNATWIQEVVFSKSMTTGSGTLRYIVAQNTTSEVRTGTISIDGQSFKVTQDAGNALVSQLDWRCLTTADTPMSRLAMDMALAPGGTVLYGGGCDGAVFSDTWLWNGSDWTKLNPAHSPGQLSNHAMAYDAAHNELVLFGGFDTTPGISAATWIWNGSDWKQAHPKTSPPARAYHAMAYHAPTQRIVLFGGWPYETDTWEWDGKDWSKKATAKSPPAREGAAIAYDAARNEIVLFGGARDLYSGQVPVFFNDTWVWNGSGWQQRITSTSLSPRTGARMEYHPALGQIVLIGGCGARDVGTTPPYSYTFDYRQETWTWDGTTWTQRFPDATPEPSYNYGMVYDAAHEGFFAHVGDALFCADRGPHTYTLAPGAGAVLLSSYRVELPSAGGSGSIKVKSSVAWNATADSWITLTSATSGSGSGTLTYQASQNTAKQRTGRIVVNDKVFIVSQGGRDIPG
jgi:M6 family metalloprotease-like protein